LFYIDNQTIRIEIPPTLPIPENIVQTQEAPKSQHLLRVSSAGKLTFTPNTIASVFQKASSSSSCQMISSQITSSHKQQQ
jgi:hypothetical protein